MDGYEFFTPDLNAIFSSTENLFRLVAILEGRSRIGSETIGALAGQGEVVAVAYGTGWKGSFSSSGGVSFFMDHVTVSGNTISWNVPLSTAVGGMVPPLTAIDLSKIYVFVR